LVKGDYKMALTDTQKSQVQKIYNKVVGNLSTKYGKELVLESLRFVVDETGITDMLVTVNIEVKDVDGDAIRVRKEVSAW
jgi:uncharacterized protein (UPF0216 family)